jgi:hypothetical protein
MKKALLGVMLGLSIFLVAHASQIPSDPIPNPAKIQFKTCEERILYRLNFYSELLVKYKVQYVWGGFWGLLGIDCSGGIYWICHMAGLPVHRTTSLQMWLNHGSWPGERVLVKAGASDRAEFPNIGFFTFSPKRPKGHVMLVILNATDKNGNRKILFREASSSQKIFKETEMKTGDYRFVRFEGIIVLDLTPGFKCDLGG